MYNFKGLFFVAASVDQPQNPYDVVDSNAQGRVERDTISRFSHT